VLLVVYRNTPLGVDLSTPLSVDLSAPLGERARVARLLRAQPHARDLVSPTLVIESCGHRLSLVGDAQTRPRILTVLAHAARAAGDARAGELPVVARRVGRWRAEVVGGGRAECRLGRGGEDARGRWDEPRSGDGAKSGVSCGSVSGSGTSALST
jgi:hypothetical protein